MDARLLAVTRQAAGEDRVVRLFDRHYLPLCRLACVLLGDAAGAEDVVQEAFLRTFSGWWRLRDPDRAERYLRRSVVNLCRSRFRHRDAERRGNAVVAVREARERLQSSCETDDHDNAMVLLEAVRALPPRQRMSIVLRYYLDLPEADVADLMGCSTGTVKSQVAKARATLAGVLQEPVVRPPPVPAWPAPPMPDWGAPAHAADEPGGRLSECAELVTEPAELVSEPVELLAGQAGLVGEPVELVSEPVELLTGQAGMVGEPVELDTEQAGLVGEPAGLVSDSAARLRKPDRRS